MRSSFFLFFKEKKERRKKEDIKMEKRRKWRLREGIGKKEATYPSANHCFD